ncbi:hypothetical protein ONA70_25745 [Micromonospora yasonensis]|uniref:hypothetical protein n=1 Tax=Micromonospora yasonensis TaxID=1128667 RepID=UPI0022310AF3|nr:hypothetical protein [Micromonospora yasonensis]MCW3843512.1 hypothetical protein [Micromonospora yasonensis]
MISTHELSWAGSVLTKRYTSWHRGEHRREWAVLRLVHRHEPDLVPRPLAADLDARPPTVTMARLPGEPLGGPLTRTQRRALVTAIGTLWRVPAAVAPEIGPWTDDLGFARRLTDGARPPDGVAAAAYDAARDWWDGPDPELSCSARPSRSTSGDCWRPAGCGPCSGYACCCPVDRRPGATHPAPPPTRPDAS